MKNTIHTFLKFLIVATISGTASCAYDEVYFEYHSFSDAEWNKDKKTVFDIKVDDISQPYDVSIILRSSYAYRFENIWLLIDRKSPSGEVRSDTVSAIVRDSKGKMTGSGLSLYNLSVPYETSVLYPDTGAYVYSIRHGMQDNPLKGISDLGLKVSKKPVK